MNQSPVINRIVSNMRAEMSRAGGRLPGLSHEQIQHKTRNNNVEGEYVTPTPIEGTITMMNNTAIKHEVSNDSSNLPPAGGAVEAAVGDQVSQYLQSVGITLVPQKRTWKDEVLEHAVPVGRTIAAVLIAEGVIALVQHQAKRRAEKKALAAAEAEALLSETDSVAG